MKEGLRKNIALICITAIVCAYFSPISTKKAEAFLGIGDITIDPTNLVQNTLSATANTSIMVKEFGLDAIAWMVANLVIERMAASTVNWINSGFEGSPAYITDSEAYFTDLGDKLAGQYIFSNPNLNFLCGPISAKIRIALSRSYLNERNWQCTLSEVQGNMEDFMGDFSKGGWDSFVEVSQRQQNNPIGAYLMAESELANKIETKTNETLKQLDWGQGFMSYQKCTDVNPGGFVGPLQNTVPSDFVGPLQENQIRLEKKCETVTPGSVIQNQLDSVLSAGTGKLQVADEIDEIVSSLLNQLVSRVVGGAGSLLGSSSSGSDNSASLTRQLLESTANSTTDYFGNVQSTSTSTYVSQNPACDPTTDSTCNQELVVPIDNDCNTGTYSEQIKTFNDQLNLLPMNSPSRAEAIQAFRESDCPPTGIH
jgi:hypothetical protein